ncbi:MAG: hypothetical protein FJZ78_01750 [Bacteroidetes bacterium]|nr:hypothetical protein [Bacteroidota bacterium]
MIPKILLGFLLTTIWLEMCAQQEPSQGYRYETSLDGGDDHYFPFSMEQEGIMVIRDNRNFNEGKKIWSAVVLDTTLQVTWSTTIATDSDHQLIGYEYAPGSFFLLFQKENHVPFEGQLTRIDFNKRQTESHSLELELNFKLTHFTVAGGNGIVGGTIGSQPAIALFDGETKRTRILPGFFLTEAELLDIKPNRNGTFSLLQMLSKPSGKTLRYGAYNRNGTLLIEDDFIVDEDHTIMNATMSMLGRDEVLISGTFTYNNSRQPAGIFSAPVDPSKDLSLQWIDYPMLENFLNYLPTKQSSRIISKTTQRKQFGREPDFRTHSVVRRIDDQPFGFIVFGESWSQSSSTMNSNAPFSPFGPGSLYRPLGLMYPYYWVPGMGSRLDPFNPGVPLTPEIRMLNSFVVGFDPRGNKIFDFSMPQTDDKRPSNEQHADYLIQGDSVVFAAPSEEGIIISGNVSDKPESKIVPIRITDAGAESETDADEQLLRFWYRNNFFIHGYQVIKRKTPGSGVQRKKVFFINRLIFPDPRMLK